LYQWLFCPVCNKKLVGPGPCQTHKTALRALGVSTSYENKLVKTLLWKYKYGFKYTLAKPLAKILLAYARQTLLPLLKDRNNDLLISYIPLHPRRYRWRGFNQSQLLAEFLGQELKIAARPIIQRITFRCPQMEIKEKSKRLENIKDSFALIPGAEIKGRAILLIDDIAASGATLIEAAKILKRARAKAVYSLVIARSQ
jgi:ComF family protein